MHICRMNKHSSRCWRYKRKWDKNPRPLELILSGLVDWLMYGLMNEWISLGKSFMIIFYRNYLTWLLPLSGTRTLARDGVQLSLSILNPTLVSTHKLHPKTLLYSRNYWKKLLNRTFICSSCLDFQGSPIHKPSRTSHTLSSLPQFYPAP